MGTAVVHMRSCANRPNCQVIKGSLIGNVQENYLCSMRLKIIP